MNRQGNLIKVKCTEIQWDTDGDKKLLKKLPKEVTLTTIIAMAIISTTN